MSAHGKRKCNLIQKENKFIFLPPMEDIFLYFNNKLI